MIRTLIDWAEPLFGDFGYIFVAAVVVLERAVVLGLIAPGDVVVATAGIFAARKNLDLRWLIVVGWFAGSLGGAIGFWLGRKFGRRLLSKLPFSKRLSPKLDKAERYFDEHGGKTVFLGRFVAGVGAFIPFTAGTAAMPYPKFTAYDVLAVAAWVTGLSLLGFFFGHNVDAVDRFISRFGWITLGIVALFVGGRWLLKRYRAHTDETSHER